MAGSRVGAHVPRCRCDDGQDCEPKGWADAQHGACRRGLRSRHCPWRVADTYGAASVSLFTGDVESGWTLAARTDPDYVISFSWDRAMTVVAQPVPMTTEQ